MKAKWLSFTLAGAILLAGCERKTTVSTYVGTARGFGGDVTAEVGIDNTGKVVSLQVTAASETPAIGGAAVEPLVAAILEKGSADVDGISGATITSNAVKDAVNAAIAQASGAQTAEQHYTPGTYTGVALGRNGNITVAVTVSENAITDVTVTDASAESPGISVMPLEVIPKQIVAYQSLGVDVISGASATSNGILSAAANALEQAGANVSALRNAPVPHEMPTAQDMSTQIVIAGGGMSGLITAITAAQHGADVVLVEKMPFLGGTLIVAGGVLLTVDSENIGENDGLDRVMNYLRTVNETSVRQPDYDFLEYLLPETGKSIDYLINTFGLAHISGDASAVSWGGDYAYTMFGSGADLNASLVRILQEQNVTVLLNTSAQHVVMRDGRAVGLEVSNAGETFTISADKVVIATGGAAYDEERMLKANPELNTILFSDGTAVGCTGDGFDMLEEIGAQMDDGPFVKSAIPDAAPIFRYSGASNPPLMDTLVVNAQGGRVNNEAPYNAMFFNKQLLRQASPAYFAIFDEAKATDNFLAALRQLAPNEDATVAVYADTLESLADKMGVDRNALRATFDRYQGFCATGVDADFGKGANHLKAYNENGGLYAVRVYAASWGTIGGAVVDRQFHPLNAQNEPIENVFAVGECATTMLFGDYYFGGFSLGFYSAAGRIAAETAVNEINAAR